MTVSFGRRWTSIPSSTIRDLKVTFRVGEYWEKGRGQSPKELHHFDCSVVHVFWPACPDICRLFCPSGNAERVSPSLADTCLPARIMRMRESGNRWNCIPFVIRVGRSLPLQSTCITRRRFVPALGEVFKGLYMLRDDLTLCITPLSPRWAKN